MRMANFIQWLVSMRECREREHDTRNGRDVEPFKNELALMLQINLWTLTERKKHLGVYIHFVSLDFDSPAIIYLILSQRFIVAVVVVVVGQNPRNFRQCSFDLTFRSVILYSISHKMPCNK